MNRMKSMKNLSLAAMRLAELCIDRQKNVALSIVNDLNTNVEYYKKCIIPMTL